ncbi:hypothetical protein PIB30_107045, partial [Stylosanthes scabra]|nr:hypothetical protein [Stylosanthes scabra]
MDEDLDMATIRQQALYQQTAQKYNRGVKPRSFNKGDLVLRKTEEASKPPGQGKLAPTWE